MKITVEIDEKYLFEQLTYAPSDYWLDCRKENSWGKDGYGTLYEYQDQAKPIRHTLNPSKIRAGVQRCAKGCPYIFGKLLEKDLDGPMADVILQLSLGLMHKDGPKYG